jgi:dihydroorotate dehydrogenase (fumarate)
VHAAKRAVSIPVIASLNGRTGQSWLRFAQIIEQAGADALEFNRYEVATDLRVSGMAIENDLVESVRNLTTLLKIPVAGKLTPFFTAMGHVAAALDEAGAAGLVLFNRFYQSE